MVWHKVVLAACYVFNAADDIFGVCLSILESWFWLVVEIADLLGITLLISAIASALLAASDFLFEWSQYFSATCAVRCRRQRAVRSSHLCCSC